MQVVTNLKEKWKKDMVKYKPSMYNYILEEKGNMYIYNTFAGTKSICNVRTEKEQEVKHILSSEIVETEDEEMVDILRDKGFIVPFELDEKRKRDFFYAKHLNDGVLRLVVHTTRACNFRCKYCSLDFSEDYLSDEIQNRIMKFIKKKLHNVRRVEINWFGGEPLLNMKAIEHISRGVMDLCKRGGKVYHATITSNGYLLTKENIKKLVEVNVSGYTITLDGLMEYHDDLRVLRNGEPTFAAILSNLRYIKENIQNSKLRIYIRINVTKKMIKSLDEVYAFYNKQFGDDIRFSLFIRTVVDGGGESINQMRDDILSQKESDNMVIDMAKYSQKDGIKFASNVSYLNPGGFCCTAMYFDKYTFDVHGKVYKCDVIDEDTCIGLLDEHGNLVKSGIAEEEWVAVAWKNNISCENCFLSALCFKEMCPMQRIVNGEISCKMQSNINEINSLILLYVASNEIPYI